MEKTPNPSKTWLWIGLAVILLGVVLFLCLRNNQGTDEGEKNVLPSKQHQSYVYDLEKTVRIVNGLLIAPDQLGSFEEYRSFLEKQDYSEVPYDVLEAKDKLMPILKQMVQFQKKHDEIRFWSSWRKIGNGVLEQLSVEDLRLLAMNPETGLISVFKKATSNAFDEYEEEKDLKGKLLQQIDSQKEQYYGFLEEFMPVYNKYMDEWNKLCRTRDKAYLALYRKQPDQVLEFCDSVLKQYPDNREALLLKAMGFVQLSRQNLNNEQQPILSENSDVPTIQGDSLLDEAQKIINQYYSYDKYSKQTAPALLLEGLILEYKGDSVKALTYFDQSAQEYPQQAAQLADMLSSYKVRTYLYKTMEGSNLINLYKSIMLGTDYFSPNYMKALYYDRQGNLENCAKEIYNHFFRRGNQEVYDGLLTDMVFCEELLPNSFNRLLPERNYINLSFVEHKTGFLKRKKRNDLVDVTVDNHADIDIANLRIFLCVQFADMNKKDTHVVKLRTIGRLPIHESDTMNAVVLGDPEKSVRDIVDMRAIGMTDEHIFWIDNVYNATEKVDYNEAHHITYQKLLAKLDSCDARSNVYLETIRRSDEQFREDIKNQTKIKLVGENGGWFKDDHGFVEIDLPRELVVLNPTFSWNLKLRPVEDFIDVKGHRIHLVFETVPSLAADDNVLYMISDYLNYAIYINYEDNNVRKLKVTDVKNLAKKNAEMID